VPAFPDRTTLGRTGLSVSPLGLGSSYGVRGGDLARAFERGVNLFYWGSLRREGFARGLRPLLRSRRDDVVLVVQSYARLALPARLSVTRALRRLGTDHCDVLLLGWWNRPLTRRVLDGARELVSRGLASHLMVSCHDRPTFARHAATPDLGACMVRYNAAHPGAERDVFPQLPEPRPGIVAYTATCWGWLLDRRRVPEGEPVPRASDCYRFALTHPAVDHCLSGPRNGAELDEALAALDRGPMDEDELAWMKRVGAGLRRGSLVPWQD
jgi:aryl-alcohol dehydrogenase-like predicted oxidoreductase